MKYKRFQKPKPMEWVQPIKRGYLMACCDCGLVHRMNFRIVNGRVQFQADRAPKYTARVRRINRIRVRNLKEKN